MKIPRAIPNAVASSTPKAPRFSGAGIQLAKLTAEEMKQMKGAAGEKFLDALHELGHTIMCVITGHKVNKVSLSSPQKGLSLYTAHLDADLSRKGTTLAEKFKLFFGHAYTVIGGPLINDRFSKQKMGLFLEGKLSPRRLFMANGGATGLENIIKAGDYFQLRQLADVIENRKIYKTDTFSLKVKKFFQRFASRVRAFFNPQKEYAEMIQWIKNTHSMLQKVPDEGLFRLAKTLEQHKTIEGHETVERLVKEALGDNYIKIQNEFNSLPAS